MGDYKDKYGTSRWSDFWGDDTKNAALKTGNKEAITHWNEEHSDDPITEQDQKNYEQYGTVDPAEGVAVGQTGYEVELSKSREAERKAAQKRAEELLSNQPDYTIPESVQGYVNMMTDIGNLLGGITDASGGGSPQYTIQPYTVKNSPGYDVDQKKNSAGGLDEFAKMAGAAAQNKVTIPKEGYSTRDDAMYSQWRLDQENKNRRKGNSVSKMSTY